MPISFASDPDRHRQPQHAKQRGHEEAARDALEHDAVLQPPQHLVLDAHLAVEDHHLAHEAHHAPRKRAAEVTRGAGGGAVAEARPGQRLAARQEQQEEAGAAHAGEDEGQAEPPEGEGAEALPPGDGVEVAGLGGEGDEANVEEAGEGQDDAERGGDAQGLEGAVPDAETDEVAVRAGFQEHVAVCGDRAEVLGVA